MENEPKVLKSQKTKMSFLTKFLIRMIIGLVILFVLCCLDKEGIIKFETIKDKLTENINFTKAAIKINGKVNLIDMGTSDEQMVSGDIQLLENGEKTKVTSTVYEKVESKVCGSVIRIDKHNNHYTLSILGLDDAIYVYSHLDTIDVMIYEYIPKGKELGSSEDYYFITKE